MSALSGGDVTNLRAAPHVATAYLSVMPQATVATAQINQASFTSPLYELTVDNTSAGWLNAIKGQTVWIGTSAGTKDVGVYRLRLANSANTMYIGESSDGDPGLLPLSTLDAFGEDQHITIINDFNVHSVVPKIVVSSGSASYFKDYNLSYGGENTTTPPCILSIGPHVADFIDTGTSKITASFSASTTVFLSETVSAYLWSVDDGTITVGSTTTQNITATFPAGHRVVSCKVTLSTGQIVFAYRHVWAHDTSSNAPYSVRVTSDRRTRNGRRATMQLLSNSLSDVTIPDGAMCLLWEDATWNGSDISDASKQLVGWVQQASPMMNPGLRDTVFEVVSAFELMKDIRAYSSQLVVATSPAHWYELVAALAHIDFAIFYTLYWHTTIPQLFDIQTSGYSSYTFRALKTDPGNFASQLKQIAGRLNCWVGQASNGTVYVRRDPLMMTTAQKTALAERMTITEADAAQVSIDVTYRNLVGQVQADGFLSSTSSTTAVLSYAPGTVAGQGTGTETLAGQLVASQTELNQRTASAFAKANNPYGHVTVPIPRHYDVFEPAVGDWVRLTLAAADSPTGAALNIRCGLLEVSKAYGENGDRSMTITLEGETDGISAPGATITLPEIPNAPEYDPDDGTFLIDYDPFDPGIDFDPPASPEEDNVGELLAWGDDGLASSPSKTLPVWTVLDTPATNYAIEDVITDPFCAKLTTDTTSGALGLWAVHYDSTTEDSDLIYEDDALGTTTFDVQQSYTDKRYYLLRAARGVDGGVGLFGYDPSLASDTYTDDFDPDFGTKSFENTAARPFWYFDYLGTYTDSGVIVTTGGRGDNGYCLQAQDTGLTESGEAAYDASVIVDLGAPRTVTAASLYYKMESNTDGGSVRIDYFNEDAPTAADTDDEKIASYANVTPTDDNTWRQLADTTQRENVRYVRFAVLFYNAAPPLGDGWMDDISVTYSGGPGDAEFSYSSDYGATDATATIKAAATDNVTDLPVGDIDDHNLGVVLAAAGNRLKYTTTYTGAFSTATGADVDPTYHSCIRIPYRKLSDYTSLNNDAAALEFIFCTYHALTDDSTIWKATINTSTGVVSSGTDITPVISATTYAVIASPHALETHGDDPRVMVAIARDESDPDANPAIIRTTDGGATWSLMKANVDYQYVQHSGGLLSLWLAGTDGIDYSSDGGATISSRDGDFVAVVDDLPSLGVLPI